jgi:hypothetical protein
MPIVDGFSSTKMIRSFEKTQATTCLSDRAKHNGRIPIFAVSASLVEKQQQVYIDAGFDGWLLKPVDFRRVEQLLKGIVDEGTRNECLYEPGKWEQGGWFSKRDEQQAIYDVPTMPSEDKPTASAEKEAAEGRNSDLMSEGSITPKPGAVDQETNPAIQS